MIDIRTLIFDNRLNQRTLAQIIGCQQSEVSLFANRKRVMNDEQVNALIEHFGKETIDAYTIPDDPIGPKKQEATVTIFDTEVIEEIKEEVKEEVLKTTVVLLRRLSVTQISISSKS